MTLILILLLASVEKPPSRCTEIAEELHRAVDLDILTHDEAHDILLRCYRSVS